MFQCSIIYVFEAYLKVKIFGVLEHSIIQPLLTNEYQFNKENTIPD